MKKILTIVCIGLSLSIQAQKKEDVKPNDDIAKQKEHYTKALDLTNEESEKFWPFTQTYKEQQSASKNKIKVTQENLRKAKSKKEFLNALEEIDNEKIQMIKNRQQYLKNCYDFLGQDRTLKVMELDRKQGRMKQKDKSKENASAPRHHKKRRHPKSEK